MSIYQVTRRENSKRIQLKWNYDVEVELNVDVDVDRKCTVTLFPVMY